MSGTSEPPVFEPATAPLAGTSLIEASAGTGKTYALSTLVLQLLLERRLSLDQILVVTFTEAATAELRERVRSRIHAAIRAFDRHSSDPVLATLVTRSVDRTGDRDYLRSVLRDFDAAAIYTIHGFCHRVLQDTAFESSVRFGATLVEDERPLRDEVLHDYWARQMYDADPGFVRHVLHKLGNGPTSLRPLVRLAARAPAMPVLPAHVPIPDPPDSAALESAYSEARGLWTNERETIRHALESFDGFRKTSYKPHNLERWFATLEMYLEPPRHDARPTFQDFVRFTTSEILKLTTKPHKSRAPSHRFFDVAERLHGLDRAGRRYYDARLLALEHGLIRFVREQLPRRKETANVRSFDDLLLHLHRALQRPGGRHLAGIIRTRFRAALIDEFQDTDPIQYAIFRCIYGGTDHPLFLIGDPKQAIYAFRGADVFTYMRAARDVGEQRFTMDTNWRSDPNLVSAVNHLFGRAARPFLLDRISYPRVHPREDAADLFDPGTLDPAPFQIRFLSRADLPTHGRQIRRSDAQYQLVPKLIAAEISHALQAGVTIAGEPLRPGDIAVLTRTNEQARQVQRALRELSVPGVQYGDLSVLATTEAQQLQRILRAVAEPANRSALKAALTTEMLGVTANELARMDETDGPWDGWLRDFRSWNRTWSERGFIRMFHAMVATRRIQERLLSMPDGERRTTNVLHLAELLHTAARAEHLGPTGLGLWLARQREASADLRPETVQIRLESDDQAVKLVTIHKSKGLEYPVTYCPFLWGGANLHPDEKKRVLFHDPDDDDVLKVDIGSDDAAMESHRKLAMRERLAENLRLAYVALTRARHRCTVVWGGFAGSETSALGYLLHAVNKSEDTAPSIGAVEKSLKEAGDDELMSNLRHLQSEAGTSIGIGRLGEIEARRYRPPRPEAVTLRNRVVRRPVKRWWRTTSFSGLTSSRDVAKLDRAEGRNRDADALAAETPPGTALRAGDEQMPLSAFPRGAKAGNFFHDLLENLDFHHHRRPELEQQVTAGLRAHGYDVERWRETVCDAVEQILDTPLDAESAPLTLRSLPRERRLNELEFIFPVGTDHDVDGGSLTQKRLACVFRAYPGDAVPTDYADRIERLRFAPLRGYLKGYIDLVLVRDGRWFVVDYKTNHLGHAVDDYAAARLPEVMAHGHYVLQYHLYSVALLRYLQVRLPDFDYERHFGGIYYLFLRGMSPATGAGHGIFRERPPQGRLEMLSEVLDQPGDGSPPR